MPQKNIWNFKSQFYHGIRSLPVIRRIFGKEMRNLGELIQKISIPYTRILDVATGTGAAASLIPDHHTIFGVDCSLKMLGKAVRSIPLIPVTADASVRPSRKRAW